MSNFNVNEFEKFVNSSGWTHHTGIDSDEYYDGHLYREMGDIIVQSEKDNKIILSVIRFIIYNYNFETLQMKKLDLEFFDFNVIENGEKIEKDYLEEKLSDKFIAEFPWQNQEQFNDYCEMMDI